MPKLLTNSQVFAFLKEPQNITINSSNAPVDPFENLRTVSFEAIAFLKQFSGSKLSSQQAKNLCQELERFHLTPAETISILNWLPKTVIELYLYVEDLDSRIQNQEEFLEIVAKYDIENS